MFVIDCFLSVFIVFFKQKTAYDMRISDWSSDVCSSDLAGQTANVERNLREALSLDPVDATALEALAEYQYRNGRYMDARAFSQRRLAAAPATAAVQIGRASCRERECQYV